MLINDAIHGVMGFDEELMGHLRPIMDQPIFQRLRHIKQVGLVDLVFPSATHTRFNHSLGCAYLASRFSKAVGLDLEHTALAVLSALIHDIGHGPFSHTFEHLLCSQKEQVKHEDWTHKFLEDFDLPDKNLLKIHQGTVENFIKGIHSYPKGSDSNLVADIVSSQLDVDRLDYLLRDSHFCGVSFGEIDAQWILEKLVRIEDLDTSPRLGIDFKGVNSVEHYLLARRLMTRGIYNHSLVLLYETLIILFLESIVDHLETIEQIPQGILKDFLGECHGFRKGLLSKSDFIERAYPSYSQLVDYDVWNLVRNIASKTSKDWPPDLMKIVQLLHTRKKVYKIVRLNQRHKDIDEKTVRKLIKKYGFSKWQLILLRGSVSTYQDRKSPLYIKEKGRYPSDLTQHSNIMNHLGGHEEQYRYLAVHHDLNDSKIFQEFGLDAEANYIKKNE